MNFKNNHISTLRASEIDFWRRSSRTFRKEKKVRNSIIREKMEVEKTLIDDIKIKQLKLFGHVQRMEENRLSKSVLN